MRAIASVGALLGVAAIVVAALMPRPSAVAAVEPGEIREEIVARATVAAADGIANVRAGTTGHVVRVSTKVGDIVEAKQILAVVELATPKGKDKDKEPDTADITAPIKGTILACRVDVGDSVTPASDAALPSFEIADASRTELRLEIEADDAPRAVVGVPVVARYPGASAEIAHGHVVRLGPSLERRASFDDPLVRGDSLVRAAWVAWDGDRPDVPLGQRLEARLELPSRKVAARAPRGAVHVRDGRAVVDAQWLLWSREVEVQIGAVDDDFAEVLGVDVGTHVALSP